MQKKLRLVNFFFSFLILLSFLPISSLADDKNNKNNNDDDICNSLLSYVNRPSLGDSACVVPMNRAVFEFGVQVANLIEGDAVAISYPQPTFRVGLPGRNEFVAFLPTYNQVYNPSIVGFNYAVLGVKHEILHTKKVVGSLEAFMVPPSGGVFFGTEHYGAMGLSIFSIDLPANFSTTIQLGASTLYTSEKAGSERYNSFNPDFVLAWQPKDNWQYYVEVFAQSETGPGEGYGAIADAGIQYLVTKNFAVDIEGGQRLHGEIGNVNNFIGFGFAFEVG